MPTIEYQPEIKPVEIDDTFFQELIDPDRRIDQATTHRGAIHYAASIAAQLVADAFFAGMDFSNQEYRDAFRTELRGFLTPKTASCASGCSATWTMWATGPPPTTARARATRAGSNFFRTVTNFGRERLRTKGVTQ